MKKNDLMQYLSNGSENAKTAKELMKMLKFENVRDVTQEIHRLRAKGEIICSATGENPGYFLPKNISEVEHFCKQMKSRIKEMKKAVKSADEFLKVNGGEII